MPASIAAEPGLLGHDAVVMSEGHDDMRSQQLLQTIEQKWFAHELQKDRVTADRLSQSSGRLASFGVQRCGCSRIMQIRFVFNISLIRREIAQRDLFHRRDVTRGDEIAGNKISVSTEAFDFVDPELLCRGGD